MFFTNFKSSQKVLKTAVSDHYNIKLQFSENTKFSDKNCNKRRVWSKLQNTDNLNQIRAKIVSYSNFLLKKLVRKKMRQYHQTKIIKKAGQNTRNFFDAVKEIMGESKNLEIKEVESKLE